MSESAVREPRGAEHIVQFYESDEFMDEAVGRFLGPALGTEGAGVVMATARRRAAVDAKLAARGFDLAAARREGRYLSLDAADTLSQFMVGGQPEIERFAEVIGEEVSRTAARAGRGPIRVFGEMVALLWARGNADAALRLERLWNGLGRQHPFSLFCAYPMDGFRAPSGSGAFLDICAEHSSVVPAESYMLVTDSDEQRRVIARLQQKAAALEAEVARREDVEKALRLREEELAEASRRKDEFLAMLGHELRNPLSPIVSSLHLLRRRRDDPESVARWLDVVDRQTQRLTRLVDDLLDVSRITRGRIELRKEVVSLTSVVDRALEQVRAQIEERGHRVTLDLPEEPLTLRADPARLEQVLANLLSNAARYTEVGGRITLEARRDGGELLLCVRDNGIGIDPELRGRIFDLFVRGRESGVRAPGGLGLGLTLVSRLVELHGGTVEARSDGPGRGSEFLVRLPLPVTAPAEAPARSVTAVKDLPQPGRRILVVDDNEDAAEGLAALLRALGHQVRTASDGAKALAEAARLRPEIALLDIAMPGMDGHELARRLREDKSLGPCVLVAVTGFGQDRDRELSRAAGFDHHLVKPIDLGDLEGLLKFPLPN